MNGTIEEVSMSEFFVEVFHERGNFSKFEVRNPNEEEWVELDVWALRKNPPQWWAVAFMLETPHSIRVTRFPSLEKDVLDRPFHEKLESWMIDKDKVEELFNGIR